MTANLTEPSGRRILQALPFEKGFHFTQADGSYTGKTAAGLFEFEDKLETIDLAIEATGSVGVAIESLSLLKSNGVLSFLGVYRDKQTCQNFGKVLTNMVLGNRLMLGSVSSDKKHFEMGLKSMIEIQHKYGDVLNRMINERLPPNDFKKAFSPDKEDIKTVICFR